MGTFKDISKYWPLFLLLAILRSIIHWIAILAILLLLLNCTSEIEAPADHSSDAVGEGSWIKYSPIKWDHDGLPVQAGYCTVFSDGASAEMKISAGMLADQKFKKIMDMFNFTDMDRFLFPTEREKIDVYVNTGHPENIAAAYWGSIFITVRQSYLDTALYAYLFTHELTHAFEFLIEGRVNLEADMWFTEGIATYCGALNKITTVEELEQWISRNSASSNKGNPITIRRWEDYPPGADKSGYTGIFELVMKYLVDDDGLGCSMQCVMNVFIDLRDKIPFEDAFEKNFGMDPATLQAEIFDRLLIFLESTPE